MGSCFSSPRENNEELPEARRCDSHEQLNDASFSQTPHFDNGEEIEQQLEESLSYLEHKPVRNRSGSILECEENWLLRNCDRNNAERLLEGKPDGTFLIRESKQFSEQLALSIAMNNTIHHMLIIETKTGFGLCEPYSFPTLKNFVDYYSQNPLEEFNSMMKTKLNYPIFCHK